MTNNFKDTSLQQPFATYSAASPTQQAAIDALIKDIKPLDDASVQNFGASTLAKLAKLTG